MNANDSTQQPLPPEHSRDIGLGDHGLGPVKRSWDRSFVVYPMSVGASGGTFWAGLGGGLTSQRCGQWDRRRSA